MDELDLPEAGWNRSQQQDEAENLPEPHPWNRLVHPKPESPWPRRLASVLTIVLAVPLTYAMPAEAVPREAPSVQKESPVRGQKVPVLPAKADPAEEQAWKAPPRVTWPKPQTVELGGGAQTQGTGLPVKLAGKPQAKGAAVPVRVELLDTAKTGDLYGLALRVTPGEGVPAKAAGGKSSLEIDYSGFRYAYGGDFGARLRMVKLPECALDPAARDCPQPEPVSSRNDPKQGTLTADVETTGLYAVTAAASGQSGDHAATTLSPSASWSVGIQSGDFSWNYEMRTPPALGGDEPALSLAYSSQSVDGRTASTNNQPSWAGEGFELNPGGYIERRYKSCMIDGKKTGDLCWDQDNATLVLGNSSIELVKDAGTKQWRPKRDDGTRIEHLTGAVNGDKDGEHWRVTAGNGTQYTFGLNRLPGWTTGKPVTNSVQTVPVFGNNSGEPCHATAWCDQGYRWNLDYAVDPHGNATTYWYELEKNRYGRSMKPELGTEYVRGAYLTRIDYGYLRNELFTKSPAARVAFEVTERCLPGGTITCAPEQLKKDTAGSWPDVPFDQICDAGVKCTNRLAPTFFTRKRLSKVTTQILDPGRTKCGASYCAVDSWEFKQTFPPTGDGLSPSLWLESVQQSGHVGGQLKLPPVTFTGEQLPNRVDATEGRAPLVKRRVNTIANESGGELRVTYAPAECKPGELPAADKNTRRCFPQRWAPPDESEVTDWFHKYVVAQTAEVDRVAASPWVITDYEYLDGTAWRFAENILVKPEHRTWSDFRGFGRVRVRRGDEQDVERTLKEFRYFRGMHGDKQSDGSKRSAQIIDTEGGKLDDLDQYAGFEREEILYDGDGGSMLTATLEEPWSLKTAESTQGGVTKAAHVVQPRSMATRTALSGGTWRRTGEERAYDQYGLLTQVEEKGDLAKPDDDECTRYTYARNSTAWMLDYPSRVQKVASACATTLAAAEVISDERVQYDGKAHGQAPIKGDITSVQELASEDGQTVTDRLHTYDVYGRETSESDAVGTKTTTTYNPPTGAPPTETVETNQLGHVERSQVEPAWGEVVAEVDANNRRVDLERDPLGRLIKVWQPDRSKADGQSPSTEYSYEIRKDGPSVVTTRTLGADGAYTAGHELYDGLMRERQTQEPAPRDDTTQDPALRDGRTITDTVHNSLGEVAKRNTGYFSTGTPSKDLLGVADADVPTQVVGTYDGTGDMNGQIFKVKGVEKWRTTAKEEGDRVHVTPPPGGTATTRIGDAEDRLIELRQYKGATPTGEYESTKYTYDEAGRPATVTDHAGNVWRHHYDLRGREIKTEDPDKGVTTFTYNDADEQVSVTDARGRTLWYGHDELGRKTSLREGSVSGPLLAEWKYDGLAKGQLNASIRYAGGQAYKAEVNAIDADYRTLRQTVTIPQREGKLAGSYVLNTRYTADDKVQSVSFPAAGGLAEEQVVYTYDELSQPAKVTGLSSYVTATRYSKLGETLQHELSAGGRKTWLTYTHDEGTRRLTRMRLDRDGQPSADLDLNYSYDPAGNITKIADQGSGRDTQCFTYDHLRRLTSAWTATDDCAAGSPRSGLIGGVAPYAVSYTYDSTGNRTKETKHAWGGAPESVRDYTYPRAGGKQPHALQAVGGDVFAYDAAGNTTRRKVGTSDQSLAWDAEGNLESVTEGGKTTSFVYDADGDRLLRKTPADATLYVDDMELRLDYAKDAVEQTRYYTINNQAIAVRTPDNKVSFLANDHLGTAQAAVDASSGDLAVRRMTPFGEDRGTPPPWWPGQRGFVGGTNDPTTGLVHLGAREYDPKTGRFLSVDPVIDAMEPQQLNAYAYANNSPVTFSDADGQLFWFAAVVAARIAAQIIARRLAIAAARRAAALAAKRAAELARQRAIEAARKAAEAARKAAEAARKKAIEAARKAKEAAARKKEAAAARARALRERAKAAEAAARRRAAEATRQARRAAQRARQAAVRNSRRAARPVVRAQRMVRSTSRKAVQRLSPPKTQRSAGAVQKPGVVSRAMVRYPRLGFRVTEGLERGGRAQDRFSETIGRAIGFYPKQGDALSDAGRSGAFIWGFLRGVFKRPPHE